MAGKGAKRRKPPNKGNTNRRTQRQPRPDWKARFIKALGQSANVRASCEAAGISRRVAYSARKEDKDFRAAWSAALSDACDALEAAAWSRATEGVTKERSHYYKGSLVGKDVETEYSDGLLMFLLKAHRPKKFRERVDVKHKGAVDMMGPLSVIFEVVPSNVDQAQALPEAAPAPGK